MRSKVGTTIIVIIALMLVATYYFRPIWWESYRYENDRVRVRLNTREGTDPPDLAGTLVLRLTGPGRPYCGWDPVHRKTAGPAREHLLRFDSVTSTFTDTDGYADAAPHGGIGRGERGLLMGGCRYNQGYVLIMSRPGFETRVVRPHVAKVNPSGQVLHQAPQREANTSEINCAQRRLNVAMKLLYPSPIFDDETEREQRHNLMIVESMPAYWQHRLPDGRRLRDYAVEIIRDVNQGVECPAIAAGFASILTKSTGIPDSNDEILAEHRALASVIQSLSSSSFSCR